MGMTTRKEKITLKNGELLDAVRAKLGLTSDYQIAQRMGVRGGMPAKWRHGLKLHNHALLWIAITLEREPGETLALYELALAPEGERPFWADFLSNARRTLSALAVGLLLLMSGHSGSDPGAIGGVLRRRRQCA